MQQTSNVTPLDTRKRPRESTEAATQNISSVTGHQAESKKARQCKGIAWRESLEDIKHIHRASYPVDFWSACSPWSIVKAQLTAACDTQRQFLAKLMHPASPSCNASDNIDANPAKRRQQYLTAAVSILSALGMDTTALDKTAASESDTSATARRIAILQAVLESIETGVPGMSSSQPSASSSSFHAVETTRDPAPSDTSPSTAAQPECDDDGHDLSPVLFSMNGSHAAQSRNASASSHVDSYVSFLDALDEDDNDTPEGARHQPAFGSLRSSDKRASVTHSGRAVPSRAGDVSTPSPPAAHEESSGAVPCIQRQTVLCAAKSKAGPKPLTVFTSLSSSPDSLCSKDRQLSPRALRVGSV